ncbi:hypothetical protein C1E23_10410 [Pseudoalteromonas phenolica]|uniref:Uncharacterized protein n=1 Tax=Pseudoalteromonas phenolica TaxID=161398 RepID=A0A4V2EJP2_9GAMM|nr:hypothetical protein [Pseudoalteromonas phenolica]RZQ53038.1 hypothetical protein C1E23_10410 [Pseudoalteromonas phenolica]
MTISIPESIIQQAAQSADNGAFSGSRVRTEQSDYWWLQEIEAQNREAAEAKPLEKARLVRTRRSPTPLLNPNGSLAQYAATEQKRNAQFIALANNCSPEKRLEWLGVNQDEVLDFETGEITPKKVGYVEPNHFVSEVQSAPVKFNGYKDGKVDYNKNRVHFQSRNWDDSYRIVCTQLTQTSAPPEANTGQLFTTKLTSRASSKIVDSGLYMQAVRGGYTTFATITFDAQSRLLLESGETTIGKQLSPFLDALGKMHKRGWVSRNDGHGQQGDKVRIANKSIKASGEFSHIKFMGGEKVKTDVMRQNERVYNWNGEKRIIKCIGASDKEIFDYVWVAEAPHEILETRDYPWGKVSSLGRQNYHVHMLMRWNVAHEHFREWAARIEALWGKGYVKLEKIKNANAAAKYLLKAVGYLTKGDKSDQGEIRGNRYNISKSARAEPWENHATHEAQHMFGLIQEYLQGLEAKRLRKAKLAKKLTDTVAQCAKQKNINQKSFSKSREKFIAKLEQQMESLTEKAQTFASELHGNFARGGMAQFASDNQFLEFINWAIGARGWRLKTAVSKLSDNNTYEHIKNSDSKVNEWLIRTQKAVHDSLDSLCEFYSRFERVEPHQLNQFDDMSLVTGDLCTS